ncbi:lycopene beta-cyclase CrtY [Sphingomonas sp. H39-1-10]|uniref:lycopene beta-cyclase CrtY n=1 Tax=Sphingomonas pollutisoli TaxID=3030829 RepID=UPI0023B8CB28|nr:lycopene beta-cyclase CrtY [Sphingomonas pollutisoli]MDF0488241.1 lycopene beta-cyclase CrtY [Sphingomonas pollutisoli]
MSEVHHCDLAIVGGGLAGGLLALALHRVRPDLDLRIVEENPHLGGNHVWSFFASDVAAADRWLVAPLVCHGWSRYEVAFPAHRRGIAQTYYSVESERLDQVLRGRLAPRALMTGRRVTDLAPTAVMLADGDQISARGVIDARGPADLTRLDLGWQKFAGCEVELAEPHGLAQPIVMDATVAQEDGYRFVYCLPFAATRMFVEDTYYSDTPDLDGALLAERIDAYVAARGWLPERVLREETGVLPVAMGGDFEGYWRSGGAGIAKAGMRAGLFHPMTGYSLPDAVRLAALVAKASDLSGAALHDLTHRHAQRLWRARGFYRILARMLFRAADPWERYRILERFYRLDSDLIGRFYAGTTTMTDKMRILSGKPPVPIGRAIAALAGSR